MTVPPAATLKGAPLPGAATLARCLARSYLVAAAFNTHAMQAIGLTYALDPALRVIHREAGALARARSRYLQHYNTHPFFTPLLMGIFLSLELKIARGELNEDSLDSAKQAVVYTLSAIGDSVFGGGVMVLWALCTACLLVAGHGWSALALGFFLFGLVQAFKAAGFGWGLARGFSVLPRLKSLDLINWGRRVKLLNAGLLVLFWWLIWPRPVALAGWLAWAAGLCAAAYACQSGKLPRGLALLALLAVYSLAAWMTD